MFLSTCGDRRFARKQQRAFERATNLRPGQYWLHADAGGAGHLFGPNGDLTLIDHAVSHGRQKSD